ncbi:15576_t:CDS:2, partial [Entrophospora sp. SA101]
ISEAIYDVLIEFLQNVSNVTENNQVINLVQGKFFLSRKSKLYIRPCWHQLLQLVLNCESPRVYIGGTPGCSKTCFGDFLITELIKRNHTVVIQTVRNPDTLYICQNGKATQAGKSASIRELENLDNWYICDGVKPCYARARSVLISSPRESIRKEFMKWDDNDRKDLPSLPECFYMPTWSIDELMDCCERCYPNISIDNLRSLFTKWGGIPRFIFAVNGSDDAFNKAISRTNWQLVVDYAGKTDCPLEITHKVVHLSVSDDLKQYYVIFASPYVSQLIMAQLSKQERRKVLQWLGTSAGSQVQASFRGYVFEGVVHNELNKQKVYYVPYAKNFAAIDSIQLFNNGPDHLYQSTVSNHHNVKNSVGSVIRLNKQIDFYFVVPKDVFPRFKYNQKFLNGEGKPYRNQPEWMRNITQFALEIDWDAYIALGENDE